MALTKEAAAANWLRKWPTLVAELKEIHNGKYTYPDPTKQGRKIRIICDEHGEFLQDHAKHRGGQGCPVCGGNRVESPDGKLADLALRHPTLDFSDSAYLGSKLAISVRCPEHGVFETIPNRLHNGQGCPPCGNISKGLALTLPASEMQARFAKAHGSLYQYDWATYSRTNTQMRMVCQIHGDFMQRPDYHEDGSHCPQCARLYAQDKMFKTKEGFVSAARQVHGDRYDYSKVTYLGSKSDVDIVCPDHGTFRQRPNNHLNGATCPRCALSRNSKAEYELIEFLESLVDDVKHSDRSALNRQEIDILVPSRKLGVEYNGLYWHGDDKKVSRYHLAKSEDAKASGIKLVHIFEDEWLYRRQAVESRLRHALGCAAERHFARKLKVSAIAWSAAAEFHEQNHLQGAGFNAKWNYGLFDGENLVAVASFGRSYLSEAETECYRFSAVGSVVGGFSKLMKAFLKANPEVLTVVSYADLRWGHGGVYEKAGFIRLGNTVPGYFWCRASERFNRHQFQKHKLKDKLKVFDPDLSESENMRANGFWKVYDCGHAKWLYVNTASPKATLEILSATKTKIKAEQYDNHAGHNL